MVRKTVSKTSGTAASPIVPKSSDSQFRQRTDTGCHGEISFFPSSD
uniref:Uncharacterized protein n=1 Tax=Peronospora matthiolae TaxID=2874970 RepID=A0AAV1T978_9STRA